MTGEVLTPSDVNSIFTGTDEMIEVDPKQGDLPRYTQQVAELLQDAQENINQPTSVEEEMNPLNDENYSVDNDAEDNPENCEENLGTTFHQRLCMR